MTHTFRDDPDSLRITHVVQRAADAAYRRRAQHAERVLIDRVGHVGATGRRRSAGFSEDRWIALMRSTRAVDRDDFQRFANALGVSARWLAVGSGGMTDTPEGWSHFGTHIDVLGPLVFSRITDDGGMPMWERPKVEVAA